MGQLCDPTLLLLLLQLWAGRVKPREDLSQHGPKGAAGQSRAGQGGKNSPGGARWAHSPALGTSLCHSALGPPCATLLWGPPLPLRSGGLSLSLSPGDLLVSLSSGDIPLPLSLGTPFTSPALGPPYVTPALGTSLCHPMCHQGPAHSAAAHTELCV